MEMGMLRSGLRISLILDAGTNNCYKYTGTVMDDDGKELQLDEAKEGIINIRKDRIIMWKKIEEAEDELQRNRRESQEE